MTTELESSASVNSSVTGAHNQNVIVVGNNNSVSLASQPSLRLSRLHKLPRPGRSGAQKLTAFERNTRFIGRSAELEALKEWLNDPRSICVRTIVGPPGIGKTRLAIELLDYADSSGWTS